MLAAVAARHGLRLERAPTTNRAALALLRCPPWCIPNSFLIRLRDDQDRDDDNHGRNGTDRPPLGGMRCLPRGVILTPRPQPVDLCGFHDRHHAKWPKAKQRQDGPREMSAG